MSILVDRGTRVLVQGITGRVARIHVKLMAEYGTKIVAGVTPGKGGESVQGVPVYDSVREALEDHPEINCSIIFVPAKFASDAVFEAVEANLNPIIVITEGIPIHDAAKFVSYARMRGVRIIGPNCPGVISPGKCKVGVMYSGLFMEGEIGLVSRSGTLTYEVARVLTNAGLGQTTAVGIGGDPIVGVDLIEVVEMFMEDDETKAIVVVGEIGGLMEERLAKYLEGEEVDKPVVAFVAGRSAPPGRKMGHAGAIISMGMGDAESKVKALLRAGIPVARTPAEIPVIVRRLL